MTRDLKAAMIIDAATWESAGEPSSEWEAMPDVSIRERIGRKNLYVLGGGHAQLREFRAS